MSRRKIYGFNYPIPETISLVLLKLILSSHTIKVTENSKFGVINEVFNGRSVPTQFLLLSLMKYCSPPFRGYGSFEVFIKQSRHSGPLFTREKQRLQQFEPELLKLFKSLVKKMSLNKRVCRHNVKSPERIKKSSQRE